MDIEIISNSSSEGIDVILNSYNNIDENKVLYEEKISKNPLFKTNFCKNMEKTGSCDRQYCDFYHSVEERRIPLCSFGNNCKNVKCKFFHSYESEESWLKRINKVYPLNVPLTTPIKKIIYNNIYTTPIAFQDNIIINSSKEMAHIYLLSALEKGHKVITIILNE